MTLPSFQRQNFLERQIMRLTHMLLLGLGFAWGFSGITQASAPTDGYGIYDSSTPISAIVAKECFPRLDKISAGGFKLVLNYTVLDGDAPGILAYLDHAYSKGMKVIFALHDPTFWNGGDLRAKYPDLAAQSHCSDNQSFVAYVVNLVKGHPGLWGYYIADEVDAGQHAQLKAFTDRIKQLDPGHPRLIVQSAEDGGAKKVVAPVVDTADVLGADWYPVGCWAAHQSVDQTARVVSELQEVVDLQTDKQSAMVLQAFSWSQYPKQQWRYSPRREAPYPTPSELKSMLAQSIANSNPRVILWYSYFDILKSDHPALRWNNLVEAIKSSSPRPAAGSSSSELRQ